jgi:SAM-dependent methyltransferase
VPTSPAYPFRDGSFDGVWACASLLHVTKEDLAAVLAEVCRVLTPGSGLLYVAVKEGDGQQWVGGEHGRRFFAFWRPPELARLLGGAGFGVDEIQSRPDLAGRSQRWVTAMAHKREAA